MIEEARVERTKKDSAWMDYIEPVWYHEVIKDKEYKCYLMRYFPR